VQKCCEGNFLPSPLKSLPSEQYPSHELTVILTARPKTRPLFPALSFGPFHDIFSVRLVGVRASACCWPALSKIIDVCPDYFPIGHLAEMPVLSVIAPEDFRGRAQFYSGFAPFFPSTFIQRLASAGTAAGKGSVFRPRRLCSEPLLRAFGDSAVSASFFPTSPW